MPPKKPKPVDLEAVRRGLARLDALAEQAGQTAPPSTDAQLVADEWAYDLSRQGGLDAEEIAMTDDAGARGWPAVRIPPALRDRCDALIDPLANRPDLVGYAATGSMSRAAVLRLALAMGLTQLEAQVAATDEPGDSS